MRACHNLLVIYVRQASVRAEEGLQCPDLGACVDHAQDSPQNNLSLQSAGKLRSSPFDASPT